jgi:hypothetical protein
MTTMSHDHPNRVRSALIEVFRQGFLDRLDRLRAAAMMYGHTRLNKKAATPAESRSVMDRLTRTAMDLIRWSDRYLDAPVQVKIPEGCAYLMLAAQRFAHGEEGVLVLEREAMDYHKSRQGV